MRRLAVPVLMLTWVLWSKSLPLGATDDSKPSWGLVDSLTREDDCRRQARERDRLGRLTLTVRISFHCFPEMVDPRQS